MNAQPNMHVFLPFYKGALGGYFFRDYS
jgi:hypothetical protein